VEFMEGFHDKASGVLFQIIVPPKSTVGFMSNLKYIFLRGVKGFFQFSISSGLL
jgi:hypothetical protein